MEPDNMLSYDEDIIALLQTHNSSDLDAEANYCLEDITNGDDHSEGIFTQHMDIRTPLSTLKTLLEHRYSLDLSDYSFWLQDSQMVFNTFIYYNMKIINSLILKTFSFNSWKVTKT